MGRRQAASRGLVSNALALVAVALATLAAGCGGSATKPLTRAQLRTKTDAICRRVTTRLATNGSPRTPAQIERLIKNLSAFEQGALTELSALVPPAALADDWKRFVAGAQTLAERTAKLGEYAEAKNAKAIAPLLAAAEATRRQMAAIARRDGFTACERLA
jgi:hypothetical protein